MHPLTRDDLKTLMSPHAGLHVSMYMPTYRAGVETQQNPIRFKNLLREAEKRLLASAQPPDDVQALLEPLQPLTEDYAFWQHQSDGLAVLRRADTLRLYRLPMTFEELIVVGDQFHLKPLMPYFTGDGRFYVLAISQNDVRMVQCTRYHMSEMELPNVPKSLAEALRFDDPEQQLQFHTGTQPRQGDQRAAIYHGQGGAKESSKDDLLAYFRQIDQGLHELLRDEQAPLVLAGVDYLHPIYQQANTYRYLTEEGITGNVEHLSMEDLQSMAWPLVEPIFLQAQADARATYERCAAMHQASADIATIVPAAHFGRVDTLFVTVGRQQWGTFDLERQQLQLTEEDHGAATDLLNLAAVQTFLHGGTVYAVEADLMPTKSDVAAVLRY
jgi:hypothetical protein